jgi:tetratricopeptide (TPR) repeat protein
LQTWHDFVPNAAKLRDMTRHTAPAAGTSRPDAAPRTVLAVGVRAPPLYDPAMDRIEYFARLVAEDPGVARARFAYATELQRAGRLEEAVGEYRAYLGLQEDEGNAWSRLGECLAALGRADEAADAWLQGIDQATRHGHAGMADDIRAMMEAL